MTTVRLHAPDNHGTTFCHAGVTHEIKNGVVHVSPELAGVLKSHGFTDPSEPKPAADEHVKVPRALLRGLVEAFGVATSDDISNVALIKAVTEVPNVHDDLIKAAEKRGEDAVLAKLADTKSSKPKA